MLIDSLLGESEQHQKYSLGTSRCLRKQAQKQAQSLMDDQREWKWWTQWPVQGYWAQWINSKSILADLKHCPCLGRRPASQTGLSCCLLKGQSADLSVVWQQHMKWSQVQPWSFWKESEVYIDCRSARINREYCMQHPEPMLQPMRWCYLWGTLTSFFRDQYKSYTKPWLLASMDPQRVNRHSRQRTVL